MGGTGSGKRSVEEMAQKVQTLRRITGGRPFFTTELPRDIYSQLGFSGRNSMLGFFARLTEGSNQVGRQLLRLGIGRYAWLNPAQEGPGPEPISPPDVAKDMILDEKVALDRIQEILVKSQDGVVRLVPRMLDMAPEMFLGLMERLEAVKAVARIGANGHSTGGQVWGLVRDKFGEFYRVAQAVRLGQHQFPPDEEDDPMPALHTNPTSPLPAPTRSSKVGKASTTEKLSAALCEALAKEIAENDKTIKRLEEELGQAREARAESVQRFNSFRQALYRSNK